jgi:hypothetical protein
MGPSDVVEELFDIGQDSVARFLARWYGPPERPPTLLPGAQRLPRPLRDWYAATSCYLRPVTVYNTVLGPEKVEEVDGKLVFWLENQEVYEWGCDLDGDDPFVYERPSVEGAPWYPTSVPLSAFLVSVAVFEAVLNAEHRAHGSELSPTHSEQVLAPLRPLPMPGPTAHAQLYADGNLLGFAGRHCAGDELPEPSTPWWVYLAAREPSHLEYALDIPGVG